MHELILYMCIHVFSIYGMYVVLLATQFPINAHLDFFSVLTLYRPAKISILEVTIPPTVIVINTPHSDYHHSFSKEIKHIEHM